MRASRTFLSNTLRNIAASAPAALLALSLCTASAHARQSPAGSFYLAGESSGDFAVAQLTVGGGLYSAFGDLGKTRVNISGTDFARAVVMQPERHSH